MRILVMIVKATSTLDYRPAPTLGEIRTHHPQVEISVLYCTLSRKRILRASQFYADALNEWRIPQYDFADFLERPYGLLRKLWRHLLSTSAWDSRPRNTLLDRLPGGRMLHTYFEGMLARVHRLLVSKTAFERILPTFAPDVVLFENRAGTNFLGSEHFYAYFASRRIKVVLLPHAPHHARSVAFTPFEHKGAALPDYCDYWMPFKFHETWKAFPEKKAQFFYAGYPGLDSAWLDWLRSDYLVKSRKSTQKPDRNGPLKCLFIIRPFLEKGPKESPTRTTSSMNMKSSRTISA